jgi:hypothetical protein
MSNEDGKYWGPSGDDDALDKYGQIEPHHNFGGGGGGGMGGYGGGGGGGGDEIVDADWDYIDEPREVDADAYSRAYNDMPEDYGNKFHSWHGQAVTEDEFDRLRHIDFVERTGGRETGGLFGTHVTDYGSGWGDRASTSTPRAGIPQFHGSGQARLSGGRSAARLPGANMPRMSAPNYPQLSDGGGIVYTIIGVVLGGIARVFGWK